MTTMCLSEIKLLLSSLFLVFCALLAGARIWDRCGLAYELKRQEIIDGHWSDGMPRWLCIADHIAGFNTSHQGAHGPMKTYGIFGISNEWCQEGSGSDSDIQQEARCGVYCSWLLNEDLKQSVECAEEVYLSDEEGSGSFDYWYPDEYCSSQNYLDYVDGCSDGTVFTSLGGPVKLVEEQDNNVTITCSAKGYPTPVLEWQWKGMDDDLHIHQSYNEVPQDIEYFAYLNFDTVSVSDTNTYICYNNVSGWNEVGQEFQVTVEPQATTTTEITTSLDPSTSDITTEITTETSDTTSEITTESATPIIEITTEITYRTSEITTEPSYLTSKVTSDSSYPTTEMASSQTTEFTTVTSTRMTTDIVISTPPGHGKLYTPCSLAMELTYLLDDTIFWNRRMEDWLCLSDVATNFNGSFLEFSRTEEGVVYYGIFKISNNWCRDDFNFDNPCNISCYDLFNEDLRATVRCSQYIFQQIGFQGWPEYTEHCTTSTNIYLKDCYEPPYFVSTAASETNKVFKEFSRNEIISCSAKGYPPPSVSWDNATMNYIQSSRGRVQLLLSREDEGGNWTIRSTITFLEVLRSDQRAFICNAHNIAGSTDLTFTVTVLVESEVWKEALIIGGSSFLSLLSLFAIPLGCLFYRMRRKRDKKIKELYQRFKYGDDVTALNESSQYISTYLPRAEYSSYQTFLNRPFPKHFEIEPHRLQLQKSILLGSGAFGIVFKGVLDKSIPVAVKTVDKNAHESKLAALLSEVKIMAYVGQHPNIVQLYGVQLVDLRKGIVFVAVEYCSGGSLEGVLKQKRADLARIPAHTSSLYYIPGYLTSSPQIVEPFTTYQLLTIAHQVCGAMEFLAKKRIIHGDLAARNVLISGDFVAKLSDFGLSRQIYDNYKEYVLASKETALPWRWLALETLRDLKFSTDSDMWAFGVLMWEIFSLAELPYTAAINWGPEFVNYLERGFRLEIPQYASEEIYQLMKKCWEAKVINRIKFNQLSLKLIGLIEVEYSKN